MDNLYDILFSLLLIKHTTGLLHKNLISLVSGRLNLKWSQLLFRVRTKIKLIRNRYFKKFNKTYYILEKVPDFTFLVTNNEWTRKLNLILEIEILKIYKSL